MISAFCSRSRAIPASPKNGLAASMTCIALHVSANIAVRSFTSASSIGRRILSPSAVLSSMRRMTRSCASTTMLRRQLAMRNISVGTPLRSETTAFSPNKTRAVGRANLAKVSPVMRATKRIPVSASSVTTMCPKREPGAMPP